MGSPKLAGAVTYTTGYAIVTNEFFPLPLWHFGYTFNQPDQ